ncbi:MAG TPA: hypothetical protein VIH68_00730, partial [Bacteroidota bacterium]
MRKTLFFALLLACILNQPTVAQQGREAVSPPDQPGPDRFEMHEVDGVFAIVRSAAGPYRSIDDLPPLVRSRLKDTAAPPIDRTTINSIATTFLVSDASDAPDPDLNDGLYAPPTLRSAIDNANHLGGAHAIVFAPGLTVIQPLLQLSAIQGPVNIDGTVAAGKIILDGSLGPVN